MKYKKVLHLLLTGMLTTAVWSSSVSALTVSESLDSNLVGTLTLHKIIENDGNVIVGDGLPHADENRIAVADIGFSYKKIADIENVTSSSEVGTYYTNLDEEFLGIANLLGIDINASTMNGKSYYKIKDLENALNAINHHKGDGSTYTGETKLTDYISTGNAMTLTDQTGTTSAKELPLGLYLVGEINIEAHDGVNGDGETSYEIVKAEAPIIESPAAPFLISIPMTNSAQIGDYAAGSVWQYDVDVYPKNQTNSITKKIIEEKQGDLIERDDYEVGDTIRQVIYADAPKLQPGRTHEEYKISDTMTESLTYQKVVKVMYGANIEHPSKESDFSDFVDFTENDYSVSAAADKHAFYVTLTESGLKKLDNVTGNSQVAVVFESVLNNEAKIGTEPENENHPTLTWRNSNTLEKHTDGNHVYDFTYELDITKTGVKDPTMVAFELMNGSEKINFVKEKDGYYHLFDSSNDSSDSKTDTLAPDAEGHLYVKGLDSEEYTLKEIKTEPGMNLLGSPIVIKLKAPATKDGNLASATASIGSETVTLEHHNGIAQITVENHESILLKTGGIGNAGLYVGAASFMGMAGAGYLMLCRKRKHID